MKKPDTGAVLYDLPSPYEAHPFGLLHLKRFIAKIRKHLKGELPKSYQRNFTRGFDGFLCLHMEIEPKEVIEIVRTSENDEEVNQRLRKRLPDDLKPHIWNRKLSQMGTRSMGKEKLEETKKEMGIADRSDLQNFADMIEFDEDRID